MSDVDEALKRVQLQREELALQDDLRKRARSKRASGFARTTMRRVGLFLIWVVFTVLIFNGLNEFLDRMKWMPMTLHQEQGYSYFTHDHELLRFAASALLGYAVMFGVRAFFKRQD
ncbi:hypothetical protein [Variovorax soli]|uniref:Uncharacterized protein n=1 Tax=Variovorax soli TaxID=376815 RepID=A0ABU1NM07_9BURK|nr:hypothetical protein [Variovorax soli]MDR6539472.1 hypothetical protein [Variovorax soli]